MKYVTKYKKLIFGFVLGVGCIFGVVEYDQMLLLLGKNSATMTQEQLTNGNQDRNNLAFNDYKKEATR